MTYSWLHVITKVHIWTMIYSMISLSCDILYINVVCLQVCIWKLNFSTKLIILINKWNYDGWLMMASMWVYTHVQVWIITWVLVSRHCLGYSQTVSCHRYDLLETRPTLLDRCLELYHFGRVLEDYWIQIKRIMNRISTFYCIQKVIITKIIIIIISIISVYYQYVVFCIMSVSYTHLDVYKRQV